MLHLTLEPKLTRFNAEIIRAEIIARSPVERTEDGEPVWISLLYLPLRWTPGRMRFEQARGGLFPLNHKICAAWPMFLENDSFRGLEAQAGCWFLVFPGTFQWPPEEAIKPLKQRDQHKRVYDLPAANPTGVSLGTWDFAIIPPFDQPITLEPYVRDSSCRFIRGDDMGEGYTWEGRPATINP